IGERKQHLPMLSPPAAKGGTAPPRGSAPAATACAADHDLVFARARETRKRMARTAATKRIGSEPAFSNPSRTAPRRRRTKPPGPGEPGHAPSRAELPFQFAAGSLNGSQPQLPTCGPPYPGTPQECREPAALAPQVAADARA